MAKSTTSIAGSEEGLRVESLGIFSGALDQLAVGNLGVLLEVKGTMGGGPSRPARLKLLRRDGLEGSR